MERQSNLLEPEVQKTLPKIKNLRGSFEKKVDTKVAKATETKVTQQKFSYRFDPYKLGEFYAAITEHVRDNPQDAPALRAFLFNIQVGMRPSGVLNQLF